jgi:hypothetical protein
MQRLRTFCALLVLAGCGLDNAGVDPPANVLNFPISMAIVRPENPSEPPHWLVVANSNYTIRYNTGSLQTYRLDDIHAELARCEAGRPCIIGASTSPDSPSLDLYIESEVGIGSHVNDLVLSTSQNRVYLAGRGDRNLAFVDLDPVSGALSCDAQPRVDGDPVPRCSSAFRSGTTMTASTRNLTLSGDPIGLATGTLQSIGGTDDGDYVLMAMRGASAALFIDRHGRPELVHILSGFQQQLVSMEMQRTTGIAWLASAQSRELGRVAIELDESQPERSFLYNAGTVRLTGIDDGADVRDLRFHPDQTINRAFVISRRPESMIGIDLDRRGLAPMDAALWQIFQLGPGPSRMTTATIGTRHYAFISCFDARKVYIFDIDRGELVSVLGGFSGPHTLAVDEYRGFLYVIDFSTSVLRLVDLDPASDSVPATTIGSDLQITATLGELRPVTQFGR